MNNNVNNLIYSRLNRLLVNLDDFMGGKGYKRLKAKHQRDLIIQKISDNCLSITVFCEPPFSEIENIAITARIFPETKSVEALNFSNGLSTYKAYSKTGIAIRKDLTVF